MVTTGLGHSKAMDRVVEVLSKRDSGVTVVMVDEVLIRGDKVSTTMVVEVTNMRCMMVMVDEVSIRGDKVSITMGGKVINMRCRITRVRVEEVFTRDPEIWVFRA